MIKKSRVKLIKLVLLKFVHEFGDVQELRKDLKMLESNASKLDFAGELIEGLSADEWCAAMITGLKAFFKVYDTQKISRDDMIPLLAFLGMVNLQFVQNPKSLNEAIDGLSLNKLEAFDNLWECYEEEIMQYLAVTERGEQVNLINKESGFNNKAIGDDDTTQIIDMLMRKKNLTRHNAVLFAIEHELI